MPGKKNKRRDQQDDKMDKAQAKSKWAAVLENEDQQEDPNLHSKPKAVFDFDFSQQHRLIHQKDQPKKLAPQKILTQQQKQIIAERKQKDKIAREKKQQVQREKKAQLNKKLAQEKQIQRVKKQQQQKQEQQLEQIINQKRSNGQDSRKIILCFVIVFVIVGGLQYQRTLFNKLSKFRLDAAVNYYEVMETEGGVSDSQLKGQYKKLVMKYHPDKNPNCKTCRQKFSAIMDAWEVLGNPQKRKHYDQSSGYIAQIPSTTLTLTTQTYSSLLSYSNNLFIIQVLDSTNSYCHFFAPIWEDTATKHKQTARFARIDLWTQPQMKGYVPYRFQLFPGMYSVQAGVEKLCQVDFQRPARGIQQCIEQTVAEYNIVKVTTEEQVKQEKGKRVVLLGGGVKLSTRVKLLHNKYAKHFAFYQMDNIQTSIKLKNGPSIQYHGNKNGIQLYEQFLLRHAVLEQSMCEVHQFCRQKPCVLILTQQQTAPRYLQGSKIYPVVRIQEWQQFSEKIAHIKNMTGLNQLFEVGLYKDGKIELGNFDQVDDLSPDQGEVIELPCVERSLLRTVMGWLTAYLPK